MVFRAIQPLLRVSLLSPPGIVHPHRAKSVRAKAMILYPRDPSIAQREDVEDLPTERLAVDRAVRGHGRP
jgi:hypothetical protein